MDTKFTDISLTVTTIIVYALFGIELDLRCTGLSNILSYLLIVGRRFLNVRLRITLPV
jgi:hypothetical protein